MIVDYRISFLFPYLESHGFLFKILIKMRSLSNDGAILIWVLILFMWYKIIRLTVLVASEEISSVHFSMTLIQILTFIQQQTSIKTDWIFVFSTVIGWNTLHLDENMRSQNIFVKIFGFIAKTEMCSKQMAFLITFLEQRSRKFYETNENSGQKYLKSQKCRRNAKLCFYKRALKIKLKTTNDFECKIQ